MKSHIQKTAGASEITDQQKTRRLREKWRTEMRHKPVNHQRKEDKDLLDGAVWRE
ncbi:hypothetical protein PO909_007462 [Leuciscus waleckii]